MVSAQGTNNGDGFAVPRASDLGYHLKTRMMLVSDSDDLSKT
jgi:hypothetical protein